MKGYLIFESEDLKKLEIYLRCLRVGLSCMCVKVDNNGKDVEFRLFIFEI